MLTTQQAAALLHVERIAILKWIERGHLKAHKFGRDWVIDETPERLRQILKERKPGRPPKPQPRE